MNLDPILLLQSPEVEQKETGAESKLKGIKQTCRYHNVLLIIVVQTYIKVADLRENTYGLESLVCINLGDLPYIN